MRLATIASAFAIMICAAVFGAILLQKISVSVHASLPAQGTSANGQAPTLMSVNAPTTKARGAGATAPMVTSPPPAYPSAATVSSCESNPNALGISRVVEIDTTGGPGFGFEHFKTHDFLREGEVVLTFDDGPWPKNTQTVLAALAAHCTKAIFFPIGLHATYGLRIAARMKAPTKKQVSLSETYALKYWWCSPPRTGIASVRPTVWTARGIGASLCSDRCVRASL
jgi:hypothetical protein